MPLVARIPFSPRRWAHLALALLVGLLLVGCADTAENAAADKEALRAPADWLALPDVRSASYGLQDASAHVEETDARLSRQMAQIGFALTNEQRQRYATAFSSLPDVRATHQSLGTAARDLDQRLGDLVSTRLSDVMNTIWGGVLSLDHYGPGELYSDYKLLAGSPSATGALAFGAHVGAQDRAYAKVQVSRDQLEREILGPALPAALAEQLLLKRTPRAALDALVERTSFRDASGATRSDPVVSRVLTELQAFADAPSTATLTAKLDTPMGAAEWASSAVIAIWQVGEPAPLGSRFQDVLVEVLRGGPMAVATLANAINFIRVHMLLTTESSLLAGVGEVAGRVGASVAIVFNLVKLLGPPGQLGDIDKWNANLSDKVRIIGDLVGISAAVVGLLATGPAAPVLGALALGISIFAMLLHDHEMAVQDASDKAACLPQVGLDAALTATLLKSSPSILQTMHDDVGLTPEQIQWAARTSPRLVTNDVPHPFPLVGLSVARSIFKLTPTQAFDLMSAVVGDTQSAADREFLLLHFLVYIDSDPSWNVWMTRSQALDWLASVASNADLFEGHERLLWIQIFSNAKAYLARQ